MNPGKMLGALLDEARDRASVGDYDAMSRVVAVVANAGRRFAANAGASDEALSRALAAETVAIASATGAESAHPIARPAFYATGVVAHLYAATVAPLADDDAADAATMMRAASASVRSAAAALDAAATLGAAATLDAPDIVRERIAGLRDSLAEAGAPVDIVAPIAALFSASIDGNALRRFVDDIGALALMLDGEALAASLGDDNGTESDDV